jgi:hypothetical protein
VVEASVTKQSPNIMDMERMEEPNKRSNYLFTILAITARKMLGKCET